MTFYKRKQFQCEETGKTRLTYDAALKSEQAARDKAANRYPEPWRKPSLEFIHFNRCQFEGLVDSLHSYLKERLFVGEVVTTNSRINRGSSVKVVEIIGPRGPIGVAAAHSPKPAEPPSTPPQPYTTPLHELPPSQLKYVVHVCDEHTGELVLDDGCDLQQTIENGALRFQVKAEDCRRSRSTFNKINIKWFIKETADRGPSNFSTWLVRDDLVKKYNLPTEMPAVKRTRAARPKVATKKVTFPMEDLELLDYAPRETDPPPPALCRNFGNIPVECTPHLIQTWNFLVLFGKPLKLHPFTLDDYIHALGIPKCDLLQEAMASLVNAACLYRSQVIAAAYASGPNKLTGAALNSAVAAAAAAAAGNWSEPAEPSSAQDANGSTMQSGPQNFSGNPKLQINAHPTLATEAGHSSAGSSEFHKLFVAKFTQLSDFERLAIDQWFKWSPGKWADPVKDLIKVAGQATLKGKAKALTEVTVAGRLRAWEIALIGFIRDCVKESEFSNKWKVLATLIGAVEVAGAEDIKMEEGAEESKYHDEEMIMEEEDEEKVDLSEASLHVPSSNGEADDELLSVGGDGNGGVKRELSVDPQGDAQSLNGGDNDANRRSSRRKRRKVDTYFLPNAQHVDDDDTRDDNFADDADESIGFRRTTRRQWNIQEEGGGVTNSAPPRSSGRSTRAAMAATQSALALSLTGNAMDGLDQKPSSPLSVCSNDSSDRGFKDGVPDPATIPGEATAPASKKSSPLKDVPSASKSGGGSRPSKSRLAPEAGIEEMAHLLAVSSRGFSSLVAEDRLSLIKILGEQWATQTSWLRSFMDACHEKVAEFKRYKRENMGKDQRSVALARYELDERLKAKDLEDANASKDIPVGDGEGAGEGGDNVGEDDDESVGNLSVSAQRLRRVRKEKGKKKEKERQDREVSNRQKLEKKEKEKEEKSLADEIKRVEVMEKNFYQKVIDFESETLMSSAISRLTPLGSDRNYNNYWWFDNYHGLIPTRALPCEVDFHRLTAFKDIGYSGGILLVEEMGVSGTELSALGLGAEDSANLEQGLVLGKTWGFFSSPLEIATLMQWLDNRGIRERALMESLKKAKDMVELGMTKRMENLAKNQKDERSFLSYKNMWHSRA
ncbi:hypothetical protein BC830DRAFT_1076670 [Chytriomyces sp. MP71]|nr:hypothetical protein BC830DRAFT_1076670 [Chytriomyces sp. MP71]